MHTDRFRGATLTRCALAVFMVAAIVVGSGATAQAAPPTQAVSIYHVKFIPQVVTVVTGTVVTWTNNEASDTPHSVTSDAGVFDSSPTRCPHPLVGCMFPGAKFSYTFNTPGNYGYHCKVHGWMSGSVQVLQKSTAVQVVGTSPATMKVGTGTTMTVWGQNFTAGATLSLSGTKVTAGATTLVSGTTLTAKVKVLATATKGVRDVTVTDPGGGTGTCVGCLTID